MKKQAPEKEPEQGVAAGVQELSSDPNRNWTLGDGVIDVDLPMRLRYEATERRQEAARRASALRQYRCAALTGILSGANFTGAMEDMVVIACKIGLLMLEADEKEATADVV